MILGIFWPLDNTDLLPVSVFLPLCIPIRVVKRILIRGRQLNNPLISIYFAIFAITFWILISFTTFILQLRNKINFII